MSVLTNAWGDSTWLKYANTMFMVVFIVFFVVITFVNKKHTRIVSSKDIANSGEPIRPEDNYHFSEFFFQPFWRVVSPIMKYKVENFYLKIAKGFEDFFQYFRRIYSGNGQTYAVYVIIFLAILFVITLI
jgi:hypothetical protein